MAVADGAMDVVDGVADEAEVEDEEGEEGHGEEEEGVEGALPKKKSNYLPTICK